MLVLSRKKHETILVRHEGVEIVVKILGMSKDSVKVGIEAPREWNVVREELLTRQDAEQDVSHDG